MAGAKENVVMYDDKELRMGWNIGIFYWLMQGKFGRIYRCKVRDPSVLN
jgi:Ni,Fe-hydrogenase III large subunit